MVIKELYIKNFGKFSEKHFYFKDGVQVISGENEFGKTTLHSFVKAMLFGMERGRGRAAAKDDFTKYEPWDGGSYAGVMRFVCGGRLFRLERTFGNRGNNMKAAQLICEDDGEELSVAHGDLEMLLGGLNAELFDSTVSIGQLKSEPGQALSEALENYAANYYETGGADLDLSGALQVLKEKKKKTERAIREEIEKEDDKRRKLLQECEYLERDMESLRGEYEEQNSKCHILVREIKEETKEKTEEQTEEQTEEPKVKATKETKAQKKERVKGRTSETRKKEESAKETTDRETKKYTKKDKRNEEWEEHSEKGGAGNLIKTGAAGLFVGAVGLLWSDVTAAQSAMFSTPFAWIATAVLLVGVCALVIGIYEIGREIRKRKTGARSTQPRKTDQIYGREAESAKDGYDYESEDEQKKLQKKRRRLQEKKTQVQQLEWQMSHLRSEWKEKEIRCQNLREQYSDLRENDRKRKLEEQRDAFVMAEEVLVQTAKETADITSRKVNDRASDIFAEITDGRYLSLAIGIRDSKISVWDGVRRIPAERLSRGTLEQIYFSIRMAASEMILEEPMPVILDDAFAFYDDKRLESVIKWLSRQKKQGIILSCHSREAEVLERIQRKELSKSY